MTRASSAPPRTELQVLDENGPTVGEVLVTLMLSGWTWSTPKKDESESESRILVGLPGRGAPITPQTKWYLHCKAVSRGVLCLGD